MNEGGGPTEPLHDDSSTGSSSDSLANAPEQPAGVRGAVKYDSSSTDESEGEDREEPGGGGGVILSIAAWLDSVSPGSGAACARVLATRHQWHTLGDITRALRSHDKGPVVAVREMMEKLRVSKSLTRRELKVLKVGLGKVLAAEEDEGNRKGVDTKQIKIDKDNEEEQHLEVDSDLDVLEDKYLPRSDVNVDPYLASTTEEVLKLRVEKAPHTILRGEKSMRQIAAELSEFACRSRISVDECAGVLTRHVGRRNDTHSLQFRTEEVSEDLDHACKAADRKQIKRELVKDVIYGINFCDEDITEAFDEAEFWSGLDAFRHVVEGEVQEPKSVFDGTLHSILDASVRL